VKEKFDLFGGKPRYVFDTTTKWSTELKRAISTANIHELKASTGNPEAAPSASHKLLSYYPVLSTDYREFKVNWASDTIGKMVVNTLVDSQKRQTIEFLKDSAYDPTYAAIRGTFFESYAHRVLQTKGHWHVRALAPQNCDLSELAIDTDLRLVTFDSLGGLPLEQGVYYKPKDPNFGVLDAFMKIGDSYALFQMTVSDKRHEISHAALTNLLRVLGFSDEKLPNPGDVKLYFVVPPEKFTEFKKQNYISTEGKVIRETQLSKLVQPVEQWVLQIPLKVPD